MDEHRKFPEDPPPRWYGSEPGYSAPEWERPAGDDRRYPDEVFRVPGQRSGPGLDPRYDGVTDTQERRYNAPGPFGEREPLDGTGARRTDSGRGLDPGAGLLDPHPAPYDTGRRPDSGRSPLDPGPTGFDPGPTGFDPGPTAFDPARPYVDPAVTAERTRSFEASMPPVAPMPAAPPVPPPTAVGPRSGEALPPMPEPPRMHAEPIDRAALRRPPGPAAPVGEGFYRTRRPLTAILCAAAAVILEVPALILLVSATLSDPVSATGVIGGTFLVIGLPFVALGMHALITGAGRPPGQPAGAAWLRPPAVYLVIGLVLFIAAALAAA